MKKIKLTVFLTTIMLLLPITFASASELTIVEPPATGTSSMAGVVGGGEIYYTATFTKSLTVAKSSSSKALQAKTFKYNKFAKQSRYVHLSK